MTSLMTSLVSIRFTSVMYIRTCIIYYYKKKKRILYNNSGKFDTTFVIKKYEEFTL